MLIQNTRQMSNPLTLLLFDIRGLYQLFLRHLKKITTVSQNIFYINCIGNYLCRETFIVFLVYFYWFYCVGNSENIKQGIRLIGNLFEILFQQVE